MILLEDVGALIGLFFALVGIGLSQLTGDTRYAAAGSIVIGMLLCSIALILAHEMKSLLIGESDTTATEQGIESALLGVPNVVRLFHMRTTHLGPEELLVAAKLELDHSLDFLGVADTINRAEDRLRSIISVAHIVYLEPDLYRVPVPSSEFDRLSDSESNLSYCD